MPYNNINELPKQVRDVLPRGALRIYMAAYNDEWKRCKGDTQECEQRCARVAWAAVKQQYVKKGDTWMKKDSAVLEQVDDELSRELVGAQCRDSDLPPSSFAWVENPEKKTTWHLPYKSKDGEIKCNCVRAAIQAIAGARSGQVMRDVPLSALKKLKNAADYCGINSDYLQHRIELKSSGAVAGNGLTFKLSAAEDSDEEHNEVGEPVTISGQLVELDELNANDWGVASDSVGSLKESLIKAPVRKCSGAECIDNEHACDYNWNPRDDIGYISDVYESGGWLWATAKITDPIAQRKINSGTWTPAWSVFLSHDGKDASGFVKNPYGLSVSLVNDPAYENARFSVSAAATNDGDNMTKDETTEKEQSGAESETENENQETQYYTEEQLNEYLQQKDAEIQELKQKLEQQPEQTQTEQPEQTQDMIPRAEVEQMIASAKEQAKQETREEIAAERLAGEVANLKAQAGLIDEDSVEKTKNDLMKRKSSAALKEDKDLINSILAKTATGASDTSSKFASTELEASGAQESNTPRFTVGRFKNGQWVQE